MALVVGTNCGFVTTAPTDDPASESRTLDYTAVVAGFTSPANAIKVTEIGWYQGTAVTQNANFEVGLYAADGAVVPGEAGTRLYVDNSNAKGTDAGWKRCTGLNWDISPNTMYFIGVQLDNTSTATYYDYSSTGGYGYDDLISVTSLPNPFGGGAFYGGGDYLPSFYAVWEAGAGTNIKINIGDTFKDVSEMKINIGDVWKPVVKVQQNIGDVWKTVFG